MHGNGAAIERLFLIIHRRWILPHKGKDQTVQVGSRRFSMLPVMPGLADGHAQTEFTAEWYIESRTGFAATKKVGGNGLRH